MKEHFDWVWENASVEIEAIADRLEIGVDKSLSQCRIANIYMDEKMAHDRIAWLLENAKRLVVMQGISLHSFFDEADRLFGLVEQFLSRKDVDLRVMLLDPTSDQAHYRAYRERLFEEPNLSFARYEASGKHEESPLVVETNRSAEVLRSLRTAQEQKRSQGEQVGRLAARYYTTAPSFFMIRIDDVALVEQYHYGKIAGAAPEARILGKDMPLFEYHAKSTVMPVPDSPKRPDLFDEIPGRDPFRLLEDHAKFAFENAQDLW